MTHEHGGRLLRTDIQGLRAIAVGMVVLFHLHPPALPGGYARRRRLPGDLRLPHHRSPPGAAPDRPHRPGRVLGPPDPPPASGLPAGAGGHARGGPDLRSRATVGAERARRSQRGPVRRQLGAGLARGRLPRGRQPPDRGAALLVAVGRGAVLLRVATADRAGRARGPAARGCASAPPSAWLWAPWSLSPLRSPWPAPPATRPRRTSSPRPGSGSSGSAVCSHSPNPGSACSAAVSGTPSGAWAAGPALP